MTTENQISESTSNQLKQLRHGLLRLHKLLLDLERRGYERARGRIGNSYEFLQLALKDPWFDWLHRLSELIVQIDEALDSIGAETPATEEDARALGHHDGVGDVQPRAIDDQVHALGEAKLHAAGGERVGPGAGGVGADPAAPLGRRARDGRGGGPLQRQPVPADDRRRGQKPRRAARVDRRPLGREPGARDHDRVGHLVVPVPRPTRVGAAGPARGARDRRKGAGAVLQDVECARRRRRPRRPRDCPSVEPS